MKIGYIISFFMCIGQLNAQINVDSHLQVIDTARHAETKLLNYISLIKFYKYENLEKVKDYCTEIYALKNTANPAYTHAMADFYLAFYHRSKGNQEEALHLFEKVIAYGIASDDFSFESTGRNNKAIILQEQGKYPEATEIYEELILRHLQLGDEAGTIPVINNLGLLNERIGHRDHALKYYRRSFQLARKHNQPYNINLGAGNVANIFLKQNQLDSAKIYAQICREVAISNNFGTSMAYADHLLGMIFQEEANYDKAIEYALNATTAFDSLNQETLYITAASELLHAYGKHGQYDNAIAVGESLYLRAKRANNTSGMKNAKKSLAIAYEKMGQIKKAYDYYVESRILADSIFNREKAESLYNIQTKYETEKKNAEISKQKLQIEKQHATRNYLIGGMAGIGVLALLLFNQFRYRQRMAQNEILLKQEKIDNLEQKQKLIAMQHVLQGQEEERMRIAKDLHDGLGGLLATARLQLQHLAKNENEKPDSIAAIEAEKIIDNAYAAVRRISHDMMPSALSNLGLQSAVEDLADNINTTGQLKVITQFYVDDLSISNQLEISLYRIIQEALNNALKHAKANELIIQITENADNIHMTIEDDGVGFDQKSALTSNGQCMKNIESRIAALGGNLNIETKSGEGLSYDIVIPK